MCVVSGARGERLEGIRCVYICRVPGRIHNCGGVLCALGAW